MAQKPSVDGFIPRRSLGGNDSGRMIGDARSRSYDHQHHSQHQIGSSAVSNESPTTVSRIAHDHHLSRSDVDDSLREIDTDAKKEPSRRSRPAKNIFSAARSKILKRLLLILLAIGLLFGGWIGVKALIASGSIFKGDIFGLVQQRPLKVDANGRSNILIIGTSEDDPGHEASYLTDSIMVMSVDQKNKNAYMFSVPRDLYVRYGKTCERTGANAGKINVYFDCVNSDYDSEVAETERQDKTRELIGDLFGMDIQYAVHVNYSVMRDVVGALGTITVNIEGSGGAPGVMDSNFDWKCKGGNENASLATMKKNCPPNGHFIEYPNGPATLDAEHALYLAQARGHEGTPTYGLGRSNFDRELNQQKIIKAIREKAMSSGTLTNPGKVSGLLDAVGNNLRTNFETAEVRTLVSLAQGIQNDQIHSINLVDAEPSLFGSDNANNVIPAAGTYDFSKIKAYIQKKMNASPIAKEDARVMVLNGSGVAGLAQLEGDALTSLGMTLDSVANAPAGDYNGKNVVYQIATDKKNTADRLAKIYGVTPSTTLPASITPAEGVDFVIVVLSPSATGVTTDPTDSMSDQ